MTKLNSISAGIVEAAATMNNDMQARPPLWWYFGEPWGAPCNDWYERGATPVGTVCYHCEEAITDGDRGLVRPFTDGEGTWPVPLHVDCAVCEVVSWAKCKRHANH